MKNDFEVDTPAGKLGIERKIVEETLTTNILQTAYERAFYKVSGSDLFVTKDAVKRARNLDPQFVEAVVDYCFARIMASRWYLDYDFPFVSTRLMYIICREICNEYLGVGE